MKKIATYFLSFILLVSSIFILVGCGSFTDEESTKVIASIERVVENGVAKLVIRYEDDEIAPDKFDLPKGEDGSGIKSVITTEKEDKTGKILKIYFTDDTISPVVFELSNGRSITGIQSEINEEDGQIYMWVKYDDNTTSDKFLLPKGQDGVGFTGYDYESHDDGSQTYTFHFSQETPDVVVEIPAPKEGNGIKSIVSSEDSENYILIINYTNEESEEIRFTKPKSPSKWLSGSSIPETSEGEEGDYYFDTYHKVIYTKESNSWIEVIRFEDREEICRIKFNLNDTTDGGLPAKMPQDAKLTYLVRKNTYFDSNGYGAIPIPTRVGYSFKGWYKTKSIGVTTAPLTDFTVILTDLELYAIWEKEA